MIRRLPWFTIFMMLCLQLSAAGVRRDGRYIMTAYSAGGTTASGEQAKRRLVAADPALLPLGSRIQISNAGAYSGEYEVGDTGGKIHGRKLDIHIADRARAKKFGKKRVTVKVIELAQPSK